MSLKMTDLIIPKQFGEFVTEMTVSNSALFDSNVIKRSEQFDTLASSRSNAVVIPYFDEFYGDSENITETNVLTSNKIEAKCENAPIIRRAKMWGATDLAEAMTGVDPIASVGGLIASYWAKDLQKELLAILDGVFKSTDMASNKYDISAKAGDLAKISATSFIDASSILGENAEQLTAVIMHSSVKASLKKQNLIQTIRPSDSASFDTYQGVRVIVDDCLTPLNGIYRSYLFGENSVVFGNGLPAGFLDVEIDREKRRGSGIDYIITRKAFILHPRGVSFTSTNVVNVEGATRDELKNGLNWQKVTDSQKIKIIAFDYQI